MSRGRWVRKEYWGLAWVDHDNGKPEHHLKRGYQRKDRPELERVAKMLIERGATEMQLLRVFRVWLPRPRRKKS